MEQYAAHFPNNLAVARSLREKFTPSVDILEAEPMLFSAGIEFAKRNGGSLTLLALDMLEDELEEHFHVPCNDEDFPYRHIVIDTKVVMLMEGMFPAIPGWHCDAVSRCSKYGQPALDTIDVRCKHWTMTLSSHPDGVSNTKFLEDSLDIPYDPARAWGSVNDYVENCQPILDNSVVESVDSVLYRFDQGTLHTAAAAKRGGWRWFFRASMYRRPPMNKIRNQVQVYANPSKGW